MEPIPAPSGIGSCPRIMQPQSCQHPRAPLTDTPTLNPKSPTVYSMTQTWPMTMAASSTSGPMSKTVSYGMVLCKRQKGTPSEKVSHVLELCIDLFQMGIGATASFSACGGLKPTSQASYVLCDSIAGIEMLLHLERLVLATRR